MIRKLFAALFVFAALTTPTTAYYSPGYVKLYNYTETELTVWVDGSQYGNIPAGYSPSWIPTEYGLHKVEVTKAGGWRSTYKYCEVSYSYPNALVEIGRYDL